MSLMAALLSDLRLSTSTLFYSYLADDLCRLSCTVSFICLSKLRMVRFAVSSLLSMDSTFQFEAEGRARGGSHYQRRNTNRQKARQDNASTLRVEMLETQMLVREGEC